MQTLSNIKYRYIVVYYLLLLGVFLSWQNPNSVPGGLLRIAYMTAVFAPIFIIRERWLIAPVVIVFHTLAHFGFTSSYMPDMWYSYVAFIVIAFIVTKNSMAFDSDKRKTLTLLIALFVIFVFPPT